MTHEEVWALKPGQIIRFSRPEHDVYWIINVLRVPPPGDLYHKVLLAGVILYSNSAIGAGWLLTGEYFAFNSVASWEKIDLIE